MENLELLRQLSNDISVSGYEYFIKDIIINAFENLVDEIRVDKLGNIIAVKKGKESNGPKIMLAAHMDEIGFMITDIDDLGFLRFTSIGGIDPRTIVGQEVIIIGRDNKKYIGVINTKPPHLQSSDEQNNALSMDKMSIDVGMSKEEAEKNFEIGNTAVINREFIELLNNRVAGKSLDNKAGVVSLFECAKMLENVEIKSDIYYVFTVQEEETMAGAITSTYNINPDIGIAVDVGFGSTPELNKIDTIELSKGPGITLGGNIHKNLRKHIVSVADKYNIQTQVEVDPGPTGTDGRAIQITRAGIPTLVLSIPLRYMHTSVEVIDMKDLENTGKLLAFFINSINKDELEEILCY